MQNKTLFAALLVGALCLSSCVKNVESESVTAVRNAKAKQIESIAKLNEATAQAEIIKANAEATIAEAQAKLLEAQAKQAEAQAALIQAQAELQAVNIQIQLVKLEEEKVTLQAKKAELQKLIAEYEAAIALANAQMQEYLNRLANAEAQAEIDALKKQAELLTQEKLLAAAAAALEDELRARVTTVWNNYSTAVNNYNTKAVELVKKEAQLAKLQAKAVDNREITYDEIVAQEAKIARLEEELKDMEEYLEMTSDEIKKLIEPAREALIAAKTAQAEATAILTAANNDYNTLFGKQKEYEQGWWSNFEWFVNYHASVPSVFYGIGTKYNDETERNEEGLYFYAKEGTNLNVTFVPLWTSLESCSMKYDEYAVYPQPVEGVRATNTVSIPAVIKFNPAHIYTENFDEYFKILVDNAKKNAETNKESIKKTYDANVEYVEGKITALKGELAAYADYVEAAKPEIQEARNAILKAEEDIEKADADRKAKQAAYDNYVTSQASISYQAQNEKDKSNALKVAEENLDQAKKDFAEKKLTVDDLKAKIELDTYNLYLADSTAAKREYEYNVAAEKVTTAIVTAKNDAIDAVTTQKGVIATAQANFDAAVEAFRAAMVVYTATPSAATLADLKTKEQDMNTAKQTMQTEEAKMDGETGLIAKMNAAIKAFNDVNDPAKAALKDWDSAKEIANDARAKLGNKSQPASSAVNATTWQKYNQAVNDFNTAKNNLGEETDSKSYTGSAWAKYNQAKDDLDVAHKANPDDSEEYVKLYDEWQEAERIYNNEGTEWNKRVNELNTVYGKFSLFCYTYYNGSSYFGGYEKQVDDAEYYIYANYGDYKVYESPYKWLENQSEYDSYFYLNVPYLHKPRIAWYEAKLKDLKAQYDENVAAEEKTVTDLEKDIAKVKEALAEYKAMETDYLAYGEELVDAKKAYYEALKDETDAKNVQSDAQAAYNALNALLTAKVYVDENGSQKTTEQLETLINQKKQEIITANDQLEELYNQYTMLGRKDAAGKYEVEYIAQLKIDIEKLEAELAILEAQIESYAAELEILLEELGGEPDVE